MIRNLLYSLSLHLILILVIYLNFNFQEFIEIESEQPITVSFVAPNEDKNTESSNKNIINEKIEDSLPIKEEPAKFKETPKPKEEKPIIPKPEPKKTEHKKEIPKPEPKKEEKKEEKTEPKKQESVKEEVKKEEKKEIKPPVKEDKKPEPKKDEPKKEVKTETQPSETVKTQQDVGEKQITPDKKELGNVEKTETVNLSEREKFNVELQIKKCYKKAIRESAVVSNIPIKINIKLRIDGSINFSSLKILNGADFRSAPQELANGINNTQKALQLCSPIRNLPKDKFEIWQEIELTFDSKEN